MGLAKFLTHISSEALDLITKLLAYNPEERLSAKQALAHSFFKELQEQETKIVKMSLNSFVSPHNLMRSFQSDDSINKSPDDTITNNNKVNRKKICFLPEIKTNIEKSLHKSINESDEYEAEVS